MKLNAKQRRLVVLGIGVVFIIFGLLNAVFKFNIDKRYVDEASFVLMIIAAGLLFGGRKKKADPDGRPDKVDDVQNSDAPNNKEE